MVDEDSPHTYISVYIYIDILKKYLYSYVYLSFTLEADEEWAGHVVSTGLHGNTDS